MEAIGFVPSASEIEAAQRGQGHQLGAILQKVKAALAVDTVVVLTLDSTRTVLEPFAMVGVDRVRRAWARVPVGKGFAGRIVSSGGAVVVDSVDETTVYNPVLRSQGVQSLVGIPLIDQERVVGVLHVGSFEQRKFGDQEIKALTEFGVKVVDATRDVTSGAEHTAALVLQRSLLPAVPVSLPGLDVAGRYVPAEGDLGGDWYDVFRLADGRLGVVMGDVVGHGLDSAVIMGRLKSALRAYALEFDDPAQVLQSLDRKVTHFEPNVTATVLYGIADAAGEHFAFSSGGHWPPLLRQPGAAGAALVSMRSDIPLGVDATRRRTTFQITLERGGMLCLFTDGLIEVQKDPDSGLNQLLQALSDLNPDESADLACSRVLAEMVGAAPNRDDIALLLIGRSKNV